jgi:hypothetical protein
LTVTVRQVLNFGDQNASSIFTWFNETGTGLTPGASDAIVDVATTIATIKKNHIGTNRLIAPLLELAG